MSPATPPVRRLTVTDLGIAVGEPRRWLVRKLATAFEPGSITAVVGPNGSGKSTLLRTLCGLTAPTEGAVALGARAIDRWSLLERAKAVAYLPQQTPIAFDMRVADVVALGRAPYRGRLLAGDGQLHTHVRSALVRVSAADLGGRRVSTLSGGERQRVMIARMLATGAPHLLMDEPTAALDVGHALALHALLRRLADEGNTIVIAMHDLDAARRVADHAICLDRRAGDGRFHVGSASTVLGPRTLAAAFGVRVTERGDRLHFELDPEAEPDPGASAPE